MLLLVGVQIISQLLVNTLWFEIARHMQTPVSFKQMLYVNCQGAVMDSITPGVKFGGEVTRAVQISRATGCDAKQAAAIVVLQKFFSLGSLLFVLLFVSVFLIWEMPFFIVVYLAVVFLIFAGVLLVKKRKAPRFILNVLDRVAAVRIHRREGVLLFLLALVIWLIYPVKLYVLTLPFAAGVSFFHISAAAFAAYIIAILPIFPGGVGGFEGTLSGLLVALGFALSDAAVVTVLFRFFTFWFVMLASLFYIAACKIFSKTCWL